jgi:autotransporter passenger strand-loop-strand repeat protein
MTTAEEKALGLLSANDPAIDGYVGFSSVFPFSYSPTAAPAPNQFYFVGVVEHEISEVLGRSSVLGDGIGGTTSYSIMDLFRYSAPNVRDLTVTPPSPYTSAYFSINNGNTNLDNWSTNPNGDIGDWSASAGADAFLAFDPSGQINGITPTDLTLMNVLGWDSPLSNTVISDETAIISAGQTISGATILNLGVLDILSGGFAVGTTDSVGGADLISGGTASNTTVGSGGTEAVFNGGRAISTTVLGGGVQYVMSGGTASGTTDRGGADIVLAGGVESGTRVSSGGTEVVSSGGRSISTTVLAGGVQYVLSGGTASGTTDSGGADIVLAGGVESGTRVSGGGTEVASSGGILLSATVLASGVQYVLSGGIASGTTDSGGVDFILAGGTESGTRVSSGGTEVVSNGGHSLAASVFAGGVEFVLSGGLASGTIVNGGSEQVLSGGIASGTTVSNGGFLMVSAGGTINGATISGATVEIASGGLTGTNAITYVGGAALILDASMTFSGTVAGLALGDFLDLRDISFISGTTSKSFSEAASNTSGTLTVSDGTHTANLTLLGQYVTAQFNLAGDGHGGTVVTDPPLTATTDQQSFLTLPQRG